MTSSIQSTPKLKGVLRNRGLPSSHTNHNRRSTGRLSAREEELYSTVRRNRIQNGDEGYIKSSLKTMNDVSNSIKYNSNAYQSSNITTSVDGTTSAVPPQEDCDAWRKIGKDKRIAILKEDDINGGSDFQINHLSPLRTYIAIADRVSIYKEITYMILW